MLNLTPRQAEVLTFIRRSQYADHISPTTTGISKHFGFNTTAAHKHVMNLQKKGHITKTEDGRIMYPLGSLNYAYFQDYL